MHARDPLPSWNHGDSKQAIIEFVTRVTDRLGSDFVAVEERVAVFDNDGTLWPERPVPFQFSFAVDRLKEELPGHPEWKTDPFVQAALASDLPTLVADGYKGLLHVIDLTHAGISTDAFAARVDEWMSSARHPRFGRPYDECVYQPMREVLAYLRANGFKTYIVSGGGADFMRVWSERVYGVSPEQVVGSHGLVRFELHDNSPVLVKTFDSLFVSDNEGKPVGIYQFIGRRPVMAFGNSDGDKAMLEYTTIGNPRPSFGLIVHHTDAEREFAYDVDATPTGRLKDALQDAEDRGWTVVDLQRDWRTVLSDNSVTAIDVLLEPDAGMLERAGAINERLLGAYPRGFSLDATHRPHVTLVQRFVRTAELEQAYAALQRVFASIDLGRLRLEAFKNYYIPERDIGLAGIVAKPTPALSQLQQDVIDALAPFTVDSGTSSAFVTTPDDLVMNPALIEYVSAFVPRASGDHFSPHVTTGVASREFLDDMLEEPFESFEFGLIGASVYQLGQFGTAAKKLKSLRLAAGRDRETRAVGIERPRVG